MTTGRERSSKTTSNKSEGRVKRRKEEERRKVQQQKVGYGDREKDERNCRTTKGRERSC